MKRFLELLCVYFCFIRLRRIFLFSIIPLIILAFTPLFWIPLLYIMHVTHTWNFRDNGKVRLNFLRYLPLWKYIADYFPINLHRTSTTVFDPNKNYIFLSAPHGIFCIGIGIAMDTEALNWSQLFPNISPHISSHDGLFLVPILREFLLFMGHVGCSEKSFADLFGSPNKGKAIGLIVGGGREYSLTYPDTYRLVLKNRMGYAKMALKFGACLVPTISFGENDYYYTISNPPGTFYRLIQDLNRSVMRSFHIFFWGTGLLGPIGTIPLRKPINVVVGDPIDVPKVRNPTNEQISQLHELFKIKLKELFEAEKYKYLSNAKSKKLKFVT